MKISVVGLGYVGVANAILLSQYNEVVGVDISQKKVDLINRGLSPIEDDYASKFLSSGNLSLTATTDLSVAVNKADFVVICAPTNYDEATKYFDISILKNIISDTLALSRDVTIVIKSTIPIGFVEEMRREFGYDNILFSPEFLREGRAVYDNLYPSRIIVGSRLPEAQLFADMMIRAAHANDIKVLLVGDREAETIKLFANTYLAMRVAFFNELDSFALLEGLDTSEMISGVCSDHRIGHLYNNPSFGYGGYCLPKDTKQLHANFSTVPQNLVSAIIDSNATRKKVLIDEVIKRFPKKVGIYRLIMKAGSDNFRDSAISDFISPLMDNDIEVLIFEPNTSLSYFKDAKITDNFDDFYEECDLILANRIDKRINVQDAKIFTRDIFGMD